MRGPLRLLADDLTGALDAAAPFASPERPVEVPWRMGPSRADGPVAASSESRDLPREEALRRTLAAFESLRTGGAGALWFKKVDSVLRGHPVAETAALVRAGGFRRCVFAPAFPEMGRVTRGGRQFVVGAEGDRAVGPGDLRAAFGAKGLLGMDGPGVLVVDADAPGDLARAVGAIGLSEATLWAGSRGLAGALAGPRHLQPTPPIGAVVVGTTHPATRAQVAALADHALEPARPTLIDPVPACATGEETRAALREALGRLDLRGPEPVLLVVGGDTLATVLDAAGVGRLEVMGEVAPGLPLARAVGGRLGGARLLTKSGGFGPPDLLRRLCGLGP